MSDCIFCKIARHEVPARVIYEDDEFIAFLDQYPASRGHTLIIPKSHYQNIFEIPALTISGLYAKAKDISYALSQAMGTPNLNVLQNNGSLAGQTVFHYHVHLVPRYEADGVVMKWSSSPPTAPDTLDDIASSIKSFISF